MRASRAARIMNPPTTETEFCPRMAVPKPSEPVPIRWTWVGKEGLNQPPSQRESMPCYPMAKTRNEGTMKWFLALLPFVLCSCASVTSDTVVFCYPQSVKPMEAGWNYHGEIGVDTLHGIIPQKTDPKELVVRIEDKNGKILLKQRQRFAGEFGGGDVVWKDFHEIVFRLNLTKAGQGQKTLTLRAKFDPVGNVFRIQ